MPKTTGLRQHAAIGLVLRPRWASLLEPLLAVPDRLFNRLYSSRYNPLYQSGTLAILCLFILIVTGIYTLFFYRIGAPYQSVGVLESQWWGGRWIRALHTYAADAMIALAAIHALRMLIQGRAWGPRALAWITGVVLVGSLLFSGWTGFVLVWDVHGQLLAVEGARILDVLPIFSEPIQRNFISGQGVASSFFFLNLLMHILLPLWALALLWLHTLRVSKPGILPPYRLAVWATAGLTVLAVLYPVGQAPEASFTKLLGVVPIDLFYSAWLIPARHLPAWATLAGWIAAGAVAASAPWWGKPRHTALLEAAVSNELLCTGCTQCYQDCPYEAIAMVPAPPGNTATKLVARVDPALCVSCGICSGSCAPMVIGPPGRAGRDLVLEAQGFAERVRPRTADIVVMHCVQGVGLGPDAAARDGVHLYPLHCAAAIHTSAIEYLLRRGAGGIYLLACPERDCTYRRGPRWIRERIYNDREAELRERVDKRRVRIGTFGRGERREALAALAAFHAEIWAQAAHAVVEEQVDLGEICEPVEAKRG